MKVLVTGGSGFIGRNVAQACVNEGWNVISLDKEQANPFVVSVQGSIINFATLKKITSDVDLIFHEAAVTAPPQFDLDGTDSFNTNVQGTLNVLQAAYENGVRRVILASSSSTYGNLTKPGREDMRPPVYDNLYPLSKSVNEQTAAYFSSRGLVETVCLRYFNTYGMGENSKGAYSSVISKFVEDIQSNRIPVIFGDGLQRRDFVYVEDVARANILAAKKGISGEIYNVGTGTSTTFNDILDIVKSEMGSDVQPRYEPIPFQSYQMFTQADMTKSQSQLGFVPSYDIRKGVRSMLDSTTH